MLHGLEDLEEPHVLLRVLAQLLLHHVVHGTNVGIQIGAGIGIKGGLDLQPVAALLLVIAGEDGHRLGAGQLDQLGQGRQGRLGMAEEGHEDAGLAAVILIRQVEEAGAAADRLDGRLDAGTALIHLAPLGPLPVDVPVEDLILGALHHGAHGHAPDGEVAAYHVHRPGMRHHQDHRPAGGLLCLDVLPAAHLDAAGQVISAAQGQFGKAHEGLEPHPDRLEQQGLAARLIQLGKADLEVGVGDIGLLPGQTQQRGSQPVGQPVAQTMGQQPQQAEQAERQPAAPPARMEQTGMK